VIEVEIVRRARAESDGGKELAPDEMKY